MATTKPVARLVIVTVLAFGACSTGSSHEGRATNRETSPKTTTLQPTTAPSKTTSPLDRYNPDHDPATCVKVLPSGQVVYVKILLVPGHPPPKFVNGAKCG